MDGSKSGICHHMMFETKYINEMFSKIEAKHGDLFYNVFLKKVDKIKFKPGQHFVLDQKAARIIKKYKIPTTILGNDLKNLDNLLKDKHFIGTVIS